MPVDAGERVQHTAGPDVALQVGVGGMQRAGDHPVLLALAGLPQVDEGDVRLADEVHCFVHRHGPAASGHLILRQALPHVGGHRHIHHLRVGQVEAVHQRHIVVDRFHLQARIERLLLADSGDRVALVVVRRKHQRVVRQPQQLVEDRVVLRARIAVLEIGAAGAADQQRVAGEHPVAHAEAVGIVGVAGRIEHVEREPLDLDRVALGDAHGHDVDARLLAHHGDAVGAVAQRPEPGDVIGVQVRVDRLDQLQIELAHELQVAIDLLEHRIDDQRLAAAPAGEEVAVGGRDVVE